MEHTLNQFEMAAQRAKNLPKRPDNNNLLLLYALYKQATVGDVEGPEPTPFDFVGKAKYDAWAKLEGTASADARQRYIDLVEKLAQS
ncbi:MAG: acyl-CoA-binding protein [Acidobacteria bacterium]|nr:acyl-CoA-binding protein [Acidobacteriota bacterium]MCB9396835.1 acyl-CoA-binding protein [Acidobacteriota bacterium]